MKQLLLCPFGHDLLCKEGYYAFAIHFQKCFSKNRIENTDCTSQEWECFFNFKDNFSFQGKIKMYEKSIYGQVGIEAYLFF